MVLSSGVRALVAKGWREAAVNLFLALLTLAQASSLVGNMHGRVPSDPIDPVYNVWAVASAVHQATTLSTSRGSLLDANIFYPVSHAAVYGDVFVGLLPLSLPLHVLIPDPVALTNILVLLSFVLSGYGAFLLGRTLTGSTVAGICAGIVFLEAPVRFEHAGHLTLQSSEWLVFAVWALAQAWKRGSWRWWTAGGILLGLAAVTNLHVVAYLSVPAATAALAAHRRWTSRRVRGALVTCLLALAIMAPLVVAYLTRQAHIDASYASNPSTDVAGLFTVLHERALDALFLPNVPYAPLSGVDTLFPGCLVILLAALGLHMRDAAPNVATARPWALFGIGCAVVLLGDHLVIAGYALPIVLPWGLLSDLAHPLVAFRQPTQAALGMSLGLSVLCAYGTARLDRAWRNHIGIRRRYSVLALLLLFLVVESWEPLPSVAVAARSAGNIWLAQHYPAQPALALPLRSRTPLDWMEQTRMMYDSTAGWNRLVNGQASVVPDYLRGPLSVVSAYPSPAARRELHHLGVHLVIVYWRWLAPQQRSALAHTCKRLYADASQWICRA